MGGRQPGAHADADRHTNRHTHGDADADRHGDADTYGDGDADADGHTYGNVNSGAVRHTYGDAHPDADRHSEPDELSPVSAVDDQIGRLAVPMLRKGRAVLREVSAEDIQELVARGWVQDAAGAIPVAVVDRRVRAEVEPATPRFFFVPWACLGEAELEELAHLVVQLRAGIR